jgi:alkanesulfonate monooxygenase SsuD/methylene tetrahydromethanopterin reductase-like flavin-dependent oxidoreductase (luciferase family)
VTKVRALLAGQPAQLSHAPGARPLRLGQPPAPQIPIWVAALGHHTTRVAAELGDGWIPALVARDRLPGWAAQLRQLRQAAAPHARPLTVAAGPLTAVDENADVARGIAAGCAAWYLSAMGEVYARSVSGQGYAAQVQAIIAANPRPSPRHGTVPPGAQVVLDQLAAYGTCDQVREQLQPWDRAADIVTILLPPGMPCGPRRQAPGRVCAQGASPPSRQARALPRETAGNSHTAAGRAAVRRISTDGPGTSVARSRPGGQAGMPAAAEQLPGG